MGLICGDAKYKGCPSIIEGLFIKSVRSKSETKTFRDLFIENNPTVNMYFDLT
jgi:hypothetical protein